jgi:hypothetical protein
VLLIIDRAERVSIFPVIQKQDHTFIFIPLPVIMQDLFDVHDPLLSRFR